jgi:hypothetical protein
MDKQDVIFIVTAILLVIALIYLFFDVAYAQVVTNSTPIVVAQPVATQPQVAEVAQQTDNNSIVAAIGAIGAVATGMFTVYLKKEDTKVKKEAEQGHDQNEFRLEATTEAVKEINNSLKATDQSNLELAKIIQVALLPFKEHATVRKAYEKYTYNGMPVLQALDQFVGVSEQDLTDYYNGTNDKVDKFDTCNDPIVQKLALVRNKSKK